MSVLIWIQTVWHLTFGECSWKNFWIFEEVDLEEKPVEDDKSMDNYQPCKKLKFGQISFVV